MKAAKAPTRRFARLLAALSVLAVAASVLAAGASADYEQVGLFGQSGNGEQLYNVTGTAINTTGAGGVEPGSVYIAAGNRVSRYNAKGEIKEVWGWGAIASGPDKVGSGFERCRPDNGDTCAPQLHTNLFVEEDVGRFFGPHGIAVDQSTGYVYVLNKITTVNHDREHNLIEVFSADGSEVIARFGDARAEGKTVEEEPEGIGQFSNPNQGIAVDKSGKVYLDDLVSGKSRVMCFRPEVPGGYEHYVYCGRSQDINGVVFAESLALDDTGHLYAGEEGFLEERSLAAPTAPALCTFNTHGQTTAMTVNPETGEVFYFNESGADISVHRLAPCDPEVGKFKEAQAKVKLSPDALDIRGLAFNPDLSWGPNRPAGILYGVDAEWNNKGLGYILAPAEVHVPAVLSESASNTRTTSTLLHAEIDPHGYGTRYVFQYLSEAEYEANEPGERFAGAMEAPAGGGEVGAGGVGQAAVAISGLSPDTAYRFRVVATSECEPGESCVTEGEALSFATYPLYPPGLPDHRAYELVSPVQKYGGEVIPAEPNVSSCGLCKPTSIEGAYPMQSSPDGEALAYEGQPFNPFEGAVTFDSYLARRTASGWQSTALIPALPLGLSQFAFDSGLEHGLLATSSSNQLEIQDTSNPSSTTPLVTETNYRPAGELRLSYGGHSADFSRQFFAANDSLTEETPFAPEPPDPGFSGKDLYEWHNGQLALVNVLPGNGAVAEGAKLASLSPDTHAVSEDGSRVFFEYEGSLYARIDGEETVQVSQSQRSTLDPLGFRPVKFVSASPDGSRVLFSSNEELSDDANTGFLQSLSISASGGSFALSYEGQTSAPIALDTSSNPKKPSAAEVQEALEALSTIGVGEVSVSGSLESGFQINRTGAMATSEALIEANGSGLTGGSLSITATRPGTALYEWHEGTLTDLTTPGYGGFLGFVGQNKDLSHFYFVDTEALGDGEANEDGEVAEAGKGNLYSWSEGASSFVAQLVTKGEASKGNYTDSEDWGGAPGRRTAEASPDGRFLAFASVASLTGYDNLGPCALALIPESHGEFEVTPGACREAFLYDSTTGKLTCASCNPTGEAPLGETTLRQIAGSPERLPQPHYLTNEGRLYFDSQDSLTARDTNEGVEDVYEYEPQGAGTQGTCEREAGCIFLISAGTEAVDSNLIAVDETGKNVFFDTRDQLTLKDKDELLDIYDAREGGGIAAETEISRAECQGENCQAPATPPNDPTPSSSTFEGAGNVKEAPTAKKHAKKHKKKAKKHAKQARAAKRNHGGAK